MNRRTGIDAKIERAEKHIQDLDGWRRSGGEVKPYKFGTKQQMIGAFPCTTFYIKEVREHDASLFIGDCVHNLRSALDHLVWQLVEAGGGTPNKDTFFPICDSPHKYASAIGKGEIEKMAGRAKTILREVQPFVTHDDTLSVMHELDRFDKHRLLITAFFAYGINLGGDRTAWKFPLICGGDVISIPTAVYEKMHNEFKLTLEITFAEPQIVAGKPVLESLKYMAELTLMVVDQFGGFLA